MGQDELANPGPTWTEATRVAIAEVSDPGEEYRFIAKSSRGIFRDQYPGDSIEAAVSGNSQNIQCDQLASDPDNVDWVTVAVKKNPHGEWTARQQGTTEPTGSGDSPGEAVFNWYLA